MKKTTLFILTILAFSFYSCKDSNNKSPYELKTELKQQEESNYYQYLKLDSVNMSKNKIKDAGFFSSAKYDGFLIEGKINNTASIAKFKDVQLLVEIFSQTKTLIKEERFVLYEYYNPNSSNTFSVKINPPKEMKSYNIGIIGASPTN